MSARERLVRQVLARLNDAKQSMGALALSSDDWTAQVSLFLEFDSVENACREFAKHQFGVSIQTTTKERRKSGKA